MDLTKIEQLYTENLEKFGLDSKSVGWSTPESQKLRFHKLLSMVDTSQPFTINELGCGYGELFNYAQEYRYPMTQYRGYDISQKMLDAGKQYVQSENALWRLGATINEMADYTTTSGIFNVKFDHQQDSWENYIKHTLKNMFEHSSKAISFNLLTKYVDFEAENLYYADPTYFFDYCKKNISRYVNLLHDYNLYEWTIVVFK
jgi:SAM-dependent methyltransferase